MTGPQIDLYGKRWGAVCHANDWRMARGRLVPEARLTGSEWHNQVAALGEQHALQQHRAITVEDLRRACCALVAHKYCSTKDLTNAQFSRLLTLFELLIDPADIGAIREWLNPEIEERRRTVWSIKHLAPDAYSAAISGDKFGTKQWENLDLSQLKQLALTLRHRKAQWHRPAPRPPTRPVEQSAAPTKLMYIKKSTTDQHG